MPSVNSLPNHANPLAKALLTADRLARRSVRLERRIERFKRRLDTHHNLRLGTAGLFALALIGLVANAHAKLELLVVSFFALAFAVLVVRTRRVARHLHALIRLRHFFDRQERRLRGLPSGRSWESALRAAEALSGALAEALAANQAAERAINLDLGLFGAHSLWTLIDETLTDGGQHRLLQWLTQPTLHCEDILARQTRIQTLRDETWFLTKLMIQGSDDFRLSSSQIMLFLKKPFLKADFKIWLIVTWAIWIIAIGWLALSSRGDGKLQLWPMAVFAAVNFASLMHSSSPFKKGVGLSHHLSLLQPIFHALESRLNSPRVQAGSPLSELCPVTKSSGPSREARKLNGVLAFMSVEANPLVQLIVNLVSPWSLTAQALLERRRRKIAFSFPQCLEELAEIEALGSLVIFDHYQTNSYPEIHDVGRRPALSFSGLFHPLIPRGQVVANDFNFPAGKSLGLLTGSNMSGKSTFLRTIGLNQTLANAGAPVFAKSFSTHPLHIETCIEVTDSLRDGYSYFYAEVKRLRRVLDTAKSGEKTLFLIDEIFRGTNNRERQIGSRAVIRELASRDQAIGFVSTHDLELTVLADSVPQVWNLHFREHFSNQGQMIFSYQLHAGPCPTTNALKIMAAEGIAVEIGD